MALYICQRCGVEHTQWDGKCPDCGNTESIALNQGGTADRMIGRVVKGKYRIVQKLGQGGMGAVYLAEQMGIGHQVALKFLKTEFSNDTEIARRFMNEAKSYALVAHPNAVTFHDFGQDEDGNLFIAMEYLNGIDLKRHIQEQRRLPLGEAADIVLQVADVLANAHSKGIVHRDLKPENIMLRKGMRGIHAKVLDFGIARLLGESTKLTMAGAIAGTPRYMAPEQVEGGEVDHRADIYALGIVFYECLTGIQPFDGATIGDILRAQVNKPMPTLQMAAPDLDYPDIERIVQQACAKSPKERFHDMFEFATQLSKAIPTQAGRLTPFSSPAVPLPMRNEADLDGHSATLMRGASAIGVVPKAGAHTQMAPEAGGATEPAGVALNRSLKLEPVPVPTPAPKSKMPWVLLGAAVAAAGGVALWVSLQKTDVPPAETTKKADLPVVKADPVLKPVVADIPETLSNQQEQNALESLGRANTEFKLGNLDEAKIRLDAIPRNSRSRFDADAVDSRIKLIEQTLREAKTQVASGRCAEAIPLFKKVLNLNEKVRDAQAGLAGCQRAKLPDTME
ncbi:MAG: protein kinase [Myxococcaceae bacterium]|nr:protein kinase [Myxococcaceae bacterium]